MGKIDDYFNRPRYENILNFVKEYIAITDIYFEMADKTKIEVNENAYEKVLVDKVMGNNKSPLTKLSDNEIAAYFHKRRLEIYEKIPEEAANIIKSKIATLLNKNSSYGAELNLNMPEGKEISLYGIYYNYIKLNKLKRMLELKIEPKRKK